MPDTDGPFGQKIPGFDLEMLDKSWQLFGQTGAGCDKRPKSTVPPRGQAMAGGQPCLNAANPTTSVRILPVGM
jgi:hypothetical protein